VTADQNLQILKKNIMEQPVLDFPNFDKYFQVDIDSSGTAIGVVLSQ
jgi:hypothetical protein